MTKTWWITTYVAVTENSKVKTATSNKISYEIKNSWTYIERKESTNIQYKIK